MRDGEVKYGLSAVLTNITTTDLLDVPDEGRRCEPDGKITYPTGRCQVCNTQVASYSHPGNRIQISEMCYLREKVPVRWDT